MTIRAEIHPKRGTITLHVDDAGLDNLRRGVEEAAAGAKVFIGDPGAMLIIRPEGFDGADAGRIRA